MIFFFLANRAARFIISSRAKHACITRALQGQRDFLLAINLSSLVGVRLEVIQSSNVKVHYRFPGNRLLSMTKLRVLFMKRVFSYLNYNNVYESRTLNNHTTRGVGQQFIESESTAIHWLTRKVVTESTDSPNEEKRSKPKSGGIREETWMWEKRNIINRATKIIYSGI